MGRGGGGRRRLLARRDVHARAQDVRGRAVRAEDGLAARLHPAPASIEGTHCTARATHLGVAYQDVTAALLAEEGACSMLDP